MHSLMTMTTLMRMLMMMMVAMVVFPFCCCMPYLSPPALAGLYQHHGLKPNILYYAI